MNTYEVMTVMLEWVSEVHLRHTITEQPTKPLEVFNNPEFVQGKCLRVRRVQNMSDHHQPYFCATCLYITSLLYFKYLMTTSRVMSQDINM